MSQPERNLQINYIELPATDIEATKRFYTEAFGWTFQDYGPDYTSFHDGYLAGGFTKEAVPTGADGGKTRGPLVVIYATSLEDVYAKVRAAGEESCARPSASPVDAASTSPTPATTSSLSGASSGCSHAERSVALHAAPF